MRARATHTTLAGALEHVLDVTEEQEFWAAVRASNAQADADPLASVALRDDLDDAADDALRPTAGETRRDLSRRSR